MTITDERPAAGFAAARRAMIDSQLRTSGVNEPWVLEAMNAVHREDFVPESARAAAYTDRAVPLGNGRFLAAPLFYGKLLAEAAPEASDAALVVSANAGYLAALVKPLVGSLEVRDLADLGQLKQGAYSLILIDGAVEQVPDSLIAALADDGRIAAGLVERGVTRLAVARKVGGALGWLPLLEMGIPVLPEFAAPRRWSF
jgi:protein-L-isoaspartate(D-aspartate) O-methyltransferase